MSMNKKVLTILLFFALLFAGTEVTAQEGCYKHNFNMGVEAYNSGNKEMAKMHFNLARQCPDATANRKKEIDKWIKKCDEPKKPKEYTLEVDGYTSVNKHFEAGGGSIRLHVRTNASSWSISSTPWWYSATRDGNAIDLTVGENKSVVKREATCYIYAEDKRVEINITQDAGKTYLEVAGKSGNELSWEVKSTTYEYHLSIKTNASTYDVTNYPKWVVVTDKEDEQLSIKVQENPSAEERTGTMVITAGDVSTRVKLVQKGLDCYLKVDGKTSEGEWNVSHSEANYVATVVTNAPSYSITQIPDWVSVVYQKKDTLKVHVSSNPNTSSRQGVIRIKALNESFQLNIKQKGKPESKLLVNGSYLDKSFSPNATGGTYTFTVSTDASYYYIEGRPEWIKVNKNVSSFDVQVSENESTLSRSAALQVKAGNNVVRLVFNQSGLVEEELPDYDKPKQKKEKRHDRVVDWPWNLTPDTYLGGLSVGYSSNYIRHFSTGSGTEIYDWKGDYAWGKKNGRLNGVQVGFHIQKYTNWTIGIGIYTGAFFDFYHSWNKTEYWTDPLSWGHNFTYYKEYSATVPLHLYLNVPILTNKIGFFAHCGPDLTYFWGAMYKDKRKVNRNMEPLYPMNYGHDNFLVGLSAGLGFHIGQWEMEVLSGSGLNSLETKDEKSFIDHITIRLSYLFHKIR